MSDKKPVSPHQPDSQQDRDAIAFAQGLFELARNGGTGPLNVMLEAGVPIDIRTSSGDSLLMLACQNGHLETASLLLERGADANLPNEQMRTPLMAAAMANRMDIIEHLLEAGADQQAVDAEGHSALDLAKTSAAKEAFEYLKPS